MPTGSKRVAPATVFILLMLALAVAAFAQTTAPKTELQPAKAEAEVGQQLQFTVKSVDAAGNPVDAKPTVWVAFPSDLAAASDDGKVTLYAPGEVRVLAIVSNKPVFATVRVKPARVVRIETEKLTTPLVAGGVYRFKATAIGANGDPRSDAPLVWASDKPAVAAVDAAGLLTAVAPGKARITARSDAATGEWAIEVVKSNVRSVAIEPRTSNARTGDVVHLTAKAKDAGGAQMKDAVVRWAISGDGAVVENDGAFVASRPGVYVVTASVGDQSTAASIVVEPRNAERGLELVGRVKLKDLQSSEQWVQGNTLYVATIQDQIQVFDISDPASPKLTETVKVDARTVNDVSLSADGKIGVLTREGASNRKNGIVFLDTADPAHPKVLSEYTETVTGGVHSAFINDHYVYLTDDSTGSMRVIDFKDPKNPKEVARWETPARGPKVQNTVTGDMFSEGRYLHDVQVKDGLAYLAYWRDGLVILDVGAGIKGGSPENPKLVSQLRFNHHELYGDGWIAGTHEVFRYKNYVFVGDEVFPANFNINDKARIPARGVLHVVDVSDINHPRKVAEYAVPEGGAHNVWVKDDVLVMGYYGGGGRVLDVSGELRGDLYAQGREIARLWTGDPQGFRPNVPFAWGARQFGDYIFFNDINSGVWIMKLGKPKQIGSTTAPGQ
jgi:hypothetical protein